MKPISITEKFTNRQSETFKMYLKEVSEIPIFTHKEEIECVKKVINGDEEAISELIHKNLRFVVSVAKQFSNNDNLLEDLVNEGNIGLMVAARKYKTEWNVKFISYAVWWIRKHILDYLAKNGRVIRVPANKLNSLSKYEKKAVELEQKLGRNVLAQEILSEIADEDFDDDIELIELLNSSRLDSLDREVNDNDDHSLKLSDVIVDDSFFKAPDEDIINADMKYEINKILDTLKPRDKRIIIALFGLDGKSPMTLSEIGEEVDIAREMVRQIKEKTLVKLKNKLKKSSLMD